MAGADEDLKSLINGVLHKAPEDRFTLDLVFEHPWCDISSVSTHTEGERKKEEARSARLLVAALTHTHHTHTQEESKREIVGGRAQRERERGGGG